MLSDQLKTVLSSDTNSVLAPKLSRKTILLKKKNRTLQTNKSLTAIDSDVISEKDQNKISSNSLNKKSQLKAITNNKKETESTLKQFNSPSQLSNSVSCQTSYSQLNQITEAMENNTLPEIPPNDPIWLEIIPADLLRETTIEKLLEENKDYFYNLLGLYLQERMQSEFNMSKFSVPMKWQTQYSKDFDKKNLDKQMKNNNIDSRFYDDLKQNHSTQFNLSAYKQYFKPYENTQYNPRFQTRTYQNSGISTSSLTTYKANHFDFKGLVIPEEFKASKKLTTGNLQLSGQTQYNKEYKEYKDFERPLNFKNSYSKLNPIQSSGLFFGKERHSLEQLPITSKEQPLSYSQTPTYKGQFTTTFKHDFQEYEQNDLKNHVKNWRQHIVKKMGELREKQQLQAVQG